MQTIDLTDEGHYEVVDLQFPQDEVTDFAQHILDAQQSLKQVEDDLRIIQQEQEELNRRQVDECVTQTDLSTDRVEEGASKTHGEHSLLED